MNEAVHSFNIRKALVGKGDYDEGGTGEDEEFNLSSN